VNRTRLRELGFELGARAEAGVSDEGAWFATAPDCVSRSLGVHPRCGRGPAMPILRIKEIVEES
jgi:hypothetical protein